MYLKFNTFKDSVKSVLRKIWQRRRASSVSRGRLLTSRLKSGEAVRLAYKTLEPKNMDEVTGPPVLIMHGMLGSKQNWRSISRQIHAGLNQSRKIVLLDSRNHGMSPRTTEHSQRLVVEDVRHMIDVLGLNKPVLIGHSLGGSTMMFLSLLRPELISGLVVVEMSPRTHVYPQILLHKMLPLLKAPSLNDVEGSLQKAKCKVRDFLARKIKDTPTLEFMLQNLYKDTDGKIKWRLNLDALSNSMIEKFPTKAYKLKYNGPCLFLGGHKSEFLKGSDSTEIRKMFPKAEVVILEGGGHLLQVDHPQDFISAITTFINDVKER